MMKKILISMMTMTISSGAFAQTCPLKIENLEKLVESRDSLKIDLVKILSKKGYSLLHNDSTTSSTPSADQFVIKFGNFSENNLAAFLAAGDLMRTSSIIKSELSSAYYCNNALFPCVFKKEIGKTVHGSYIIHKKSDGHTDPFDHVSFPDFEYKYNDEIAPTKFIRVLLNALPTCKKLTH